MEFDGDAVARTADAAHFGRLAASEAGYFADAFLRCFAGADSTAEQTFFSPPPEPEKLIIGKNI